MSAAAVPVPPKPRSGAMIAVLGLVAMLSGVLVVLAYEATRDTIAEQHRQALEEAVRQVLPGAATIRPFVATADGVRPADDAKEAPPGINQQAAIPFHAGFDTAGHLVGIAAEGSAPGYADLIRVLYGYDPACRCIVGISILQNRDTPGFGDRAYKDSAFLANFDRLDARLDAAGTAPAHPIVTVKHGTKREPWQIDALSGATVTSKAFGKALRDATAALLPRVVPHFAELEMAGTARPTETMTHSTESETAGTARPTEAR